MNRFDLTIQGHGRGGGSQGEVLDKSPVHRRTFKDEQPHTLGLCEQAREHRGNPLRHMENMQSPTQDLHAVRQQC